MILFRFHSDQILGSIGASSKNRGKIGQARGPLNSDVIPERVILDCVELSLFYGRKKVQISC